MNGTGFEGRKLEGVRNERKVGLIVTVPSPAILVMVIEKQDFRSRIISLQKP